MLRQQKSTMILLARRCCWQKKKEEEEQRRERFRTKYFELLLVDGTDGKKKSLTNQIVRFMVDLHLTTDAAIHAIDRDAQNAPDRYARWVKAAEKLPDLFAYELKEAFGPLTNSVSPAQLKEYKRSQELPSAFNSPDYIQEE